MSTAAQAPSPGPTFTPPPVGPRPRKVSALLGDAMRRPGGRRAMSVVTVLLVLAGVSMFAYPVLTDVLARQKQGSLTSQFDNPQFQDAYRERRVKVGEGLTRLIIPHLHVDVLVVEGTTPAALRAGAGHYPDTPLPCEKGNVGIAGHRTTYGRPFNRLDEMRPGDVVILETPFARCTYKTVPAFAGHANPWSVLPDAFEVVAQRGPLGAGHFLTLTTCHPKGSASHRLVLRLSLVKVEQIDRAKNGKG
jgi:sortase A